MRNLINLTDDQIEEEFAELGIGACCDDEYGDIVFTRDTIDDFVDAAKNYNEHGKITKTEKTLIIERAQPRKGDTRSDLYVIDFGEVRGCFH